MNHKIKIMNVVGARPNFMKIAPLIRIMDRKESYLSHILVHTGQHYDESMSDNFIKQLGIPQPIVNLGVGSGSHAEQTAKIMVGFEKILIEHEPDVVVLVGDVNSTIACALVSSKMGVRVAHVEAGLRSFDRTMPEEINRILTDAISDLLFTTEPSGHKNLRHEGIPAEKIFFVGNVMIDTLIHSLDKIRTAELPFEGIQDNHYAVVTLHRPSNVDNPEILRKILEALFALGKELTLVITLHPRTIKNINELGMNDKLNKIGKSSIVTGPINYLEMLRLTRSAKLVITDSGGLQEETTYLGIPCITMRQNTERPVTITEGTNVLVGSDIDALLAYCDEILCGRFKEGRIPELWDGKASERIVDIILST
jgi:UDP-N-acetylglucosamine 2-epimerase (non-hydrolysing)